MKSVSCWKNRIFRIDHYLGKETVQNLLALRFANSLFEPLWDRGNIDHVQITVAEDLVVGGRTEFYDQVGTYDVELTVTDNEGVSKKNRLEVGR